MSEQREAELAQRAEPYALAVVVRVDRPVSAHAGDRAVVTADGRLSGWVGGSCAEPVVVREGGPAPPRPRARPAGPGWCASARQVRPLARTRARWWPRSRAW
jgi:xanthine dehydrogenase accessory factor